MRSARRAPPAARRRPRRTVVVASRADERAEDAALHPQRQGGDGAHAQHLAALGWRERASISSWVASSTARRASRRTASAARRRFDLDPLDGVVDVLLHLVGGQVMCSRSDPPSEAKTAGGSTAPPAPSPAQHHLGEVLEAGGVGQLGGHLGDRRRPLQRRRPGRPARGRRSRRAPCPGPPPRPSRPAPPGRGTPPAPCRRPGRRGSRRELAARLGGRAEGHRWRSDGRRGGRDRS